MLKQSSFQQHIEGKATDLFFLQNNNGMSVILTNYGARIVGINVPKKNGNLVDVVMGFKDIQGYLQADCPYHGATIGRYANRIANGVFTLNTKKHHVTINEGSNHLHGGRRGFHDRVWRIMEFSEESLKLAFDSTDGEEGYPGKLKVMVEYFLSDDNQLLITYSAECDQQTIINLTNHSFFNLNGESGSDILSHKLMINADYFTPINKQLIPTGEYDAVEGTPFDFRTPKEIGKHINVKDDQLLYGGGYDHNFVLKKNSKEALKLAAIVQGNQSGITMTVHTNEPGLQFYSGNFMKGVDTFKYGNKDVYRSAFALETQHFPDSPNHFYFPTTILEKDQKFFSQSVYQFSTGEI